MVFVRVVADSPAAPANFPAGIKSIEKSLYLDDVNPSVVHNEIIKLNVEIYIHYINHAAAAAPPPAAAKMINENTVNELVTRLLIQTNNNNPLAQPVNINPDAKYHFHYDNHLLSRFCSPVVMPGGVPDWNTFDTFTFYGFGLTLNNSHNAQNKFSLGERNGTPNSPGNIEIKYGNDEFCYANPQFTRKKNMVFNFHIQVIMSNAIVLAPLIDQINQTITSIRAALPALQALAQYQEVLRLRISELEIINLAPPNHAKNDRVGSINANRFISSSSNSAKNSTKVARILYYLGLRDFLIFVQNPAMLLGSWLALAKWMNDVSPEQQNVLQNLLGENPTLPSNTQQANRLRTLQNNLLLYLQRQMAFKQKITDLNQLLQNGQQPQQNQLLEPQDMAEFIEFSEQINQVDQQLQNALPHNIVAEIDNLATPPRRLALQNLRNDIQNNIMPPMAARLHSFQFSYTPPNTPLNPKSGIDYYLVGPFNNWLGAGTVPPEIAPVPFKDDRWIMRKHSNQNNILSCEIKLDSTGRNQDINTPEYYYQCKVVKYCQNGGHTLAWFPPSPAPSHKFLAPPNHPNPVIIPS